MLVTNIPIKAIKLPARENNKLLYPITIVGSFSTQFNSEKQSKLWNQLYLSNGYLSWSILCWDSGDTCMRSSLWMQHLDKYIHYVGVRELFKPLSSGWTGVSGGPKVAAASTNYHPLSHTIDASRAVANGTKSFCYFQKNFHSTRIYPKNICIMHSYAFGPRRNFSSHGLANTLATCFSPLSSNANYNFETEKLM